MNSPVSPTKIDNLGDIMHNLFECRDALGDIVRQTGGKCPAGVEPITWERVRLLLGEKLS